MSIGVKMYTVEYWVNGKSETYRKTMNKKDALKACKQLKAEIQLNAAFDDKKVLIVIWAGVAGLKSEDVIGCKYKENTPRQRD